MKIVGKRYWTWMSIWFLSIFIRGEFTAFSQEPTKPRPALTIPKTHKVPAGPHSKTKTAPDDWNVGGGGGTTAKDKWAGGGGGTTFKDKWAGGGGKSGTPHKDDWSSQSKTSKHHTHTSSK